MPTLPHIRRAQTTDAVSLLAFYNALSETSKRTFRPLGLQTTLDVCAAIIRDNHPDRNDKLDLLALGGSDTVGWGFVHNLNAEEPFLGLCVADAWQGQGLGARLLDEVMAAARDRGLAKIILTVVQDNKPAQLLYKRRGFVRYGELIGDDGLPYYQMRTVIKPPATS